MRQADIYICLYVCTCMTQFQWQQQHPPTGPIQPLRLRLCQHARHCTTLTVYCAAPHMQLRLSNSCNNNSHCHCFICTIIFTIVYYLSNSHNPVHMYVHMQLCMYMCICLLPSIFLPILYAWHAPIWLLQRFACPMYYMRPTQNWQLFIVVAYNTHIHINKHDFQLY